MGVSKDHLELVPGCDSTHHVADGTSHSAKNSISLLLLQPHPELNPILLGFELLFSHLEGDVLEALS